MTLLELITMCLKDIGAYHPGETGLDSGEVQDAVDALNNLLHEWGGHGLMTHFVTREYFNLVAGQASYTWGTGGDFNSNRPVKVLGGFIRDGSNDYDLDLVMRDEYEGVSLKTDSGRPNMVWVNYTYPSLTSYFYYVPDQVYQVFFDSEKDFADVSILTATITFPKVYEAAIRWNLDADLCPSYEREVPAWIAKRAADTLAVVKRVNTANTLQPIKQNLFPGRAGSIWVYGNIQGGLPSD